jgi:hypothetical protein
MFLIKIKIKVVTTLISFSGTGFRTQVQLLALEVKAQGKEMQS